MCFHVDGNFIHWLLFMKTHSEKELNPLCNFKGQNNLEPNQRHLCKLYWPPYINFTGTLLFLEELLVKNHDYNLEKKCNTSWSESQRLSSAMRILLLVITFEHPALDLITSLGGEGITFYYSLYSLFHPNCTLDLVLIRTASLIHNSLDISTL